MPINDLPSGTGFNPPPFEDEVETALESAGATDEPHGAGEGQTLPCTLSLLDVTTPCLPTVPDPQPPDSPADPDLDPVAMVNADLDRPHVPSHRLKHIHRVRLNYWALLKRSKRANALFLTLTLQDEGDGKPDSLDAARRLRSARGLLDEVFREWMLIMEFNPASGLPHFHGIGIARHNVSAGWQRQPVQERRKIRQTAQREGRFLTPDEQVRVDACSKAMTPNPRLWAIWRKLRTEHPTHGFGTARPCEVAPLDDARKALSYIVKDAERPNRPTTRYCKGTRLFYHSASFTVVCTTDFSWNTPRTRLDRLRKTRIAQALRVSPERCKLLFGGAWCLRLNRVIGELNRRNPGWRGGSDTDVEQHVITALASLPARSGWNGQVTPDADTDTPRWARHLADSLWERRERHRQGQPEDPEPESAYSSLDDIRRAAGQRAARQSIGTIGTIGPVTPDSQ